MRSAKLYRMRSANSLREVAKSLRDARMRSEMLHSILASRLRATHPSFALCILTSRSDFATSGNNFAKRDFAKRLRNFAKRVRKESWAMRNDYYIIFFYIIQVHTMHPVHNCHHIKSCHPPVKQYITTHQNMEFIYQFTIFILLYQYLKECPPQGTSLDVSLPPLFSSTITPPLLLSLARLLPPTRSLLPPLASYRLYFPRAFHASFRPFLARSIIKPPSLNPPSLPPSTPAPSLSHIIASSLSPAH